MIEQNEDVTVDVCGLDPITHEGDEALEVSGIVLPTERLVRVYLAGMEEAALGFGGFALGQINDVLDESNLPLSARVIGL